MNADDFDLKALLRMARLPVRNYVIPGLTSSLIGSTSPQGCVRLLQNSRDHQEAVAPHSHRYDFQCWVLRGEVTNRLWMRHHQHPFADEYQETWLRYGGEPGEYISQPGETQRWRYIDRKYTEGQCYSMQADEVHSIHFSRDAIVMFFEGPTVADRSIVLQPVVDGEVIPTAAVQPWMFKRGAHGTEEPK